jgi:hypothetical protein
VGPFGVDFRVHCYWALRVQQVPNLLFRRKYFLPNIIVIVIPDTDDA